MNESNGYDHSDICIMRGGQGEQRAQQGEQRGQQRQGTRRGYNMARAKGKFVQYIDNASKIMPLSIAL